MKRTRILLTLLPVLLLTEMKAEHDTASDFGKKHSSQLDKFEDDYIRTLTIEESVDLAKAHSADLDRLAVTLKGIDLQLSWVFENLVNLNTPGYKKIAILRDFAPVDSKRTGSRPMRMFQMGSLQSTGNKLDIAISNSEGFFKVVDPKGRAFYRRHGSFQLNKDGFFTDLCGNVLIPNIQIGPEYLIDDLAINEEGIATIGDAKGVRKSLGSLKLYHVPSIEKLSYVADCNYFRIDGVPDEAKPYTPGGGGLGGLLQGFIEMSNVNIHEERTSQIILLRSRKIIFNSMRLISPKTRLKQ